MGEPALPLCAWWWGGSWCVPSFLFVNVCARFCCSVRFELLRNGVRSTALLCTHRHIRGLPSFSCPIPRQQQLCGAPAVNRKAAAVTKQLQQQQQQKKLLSVPLLSDLS